MISTASDPPDQALGLEGQDGIQPRGIPCRRGNKVVQLLMVVWRDARRHRLDTLPVAWAEQALQMERRPALPPFVQQRGQGGCLPAGPPASGREGRRYLCS